MDNIRAHDDPARDALHDMHLWAPFHLKFKQGYQYVKKGKIYRAGHRAVKSIAFALLLVIDFVFFGIRLKGRKNVKALKGTGAVTICNHVHPLDCTMVGAMTGYRMQYFTTLQTNLEVPVVRHLVRILGGVPIPLSPKRMGDFKAAAIEALREGNLLHIYPEGVLKNYCPRLRAFKNGAFVFASEAGVPVLPMIITYRKPRGFYRLYKRKPLLTLTVLDAVYPDTQAPKRAEAHRLNFLCHERMEAYFNENSAEILQGASKDKKS